MSEREVESWRERERERTYREIEKPRMRGQGRRGIVEIGVSSSGTVISVTHHEISSIRYRHILDT